VKQEVHNSQTDNSNLSKHEHFQIDNNKNIKEFNKLILNNNNQKNQPIFVTLTKIIIYNLNQK
jgi:hypothetical protein